MSLRSSLYLASDSSSPLWSLFRRATFPSLTSRSSGSDGIRRKESAPLLSDSTARSRVSASESIRAPTCGSASRSASRTSTPSTSGSLTSMTAASKRPFFTSVSASAPE